MGVKKPINTAPIDPEKVIKIICTELPEDYEEEDGEYELTWASHPKDAYFHNIVTIKKELLNLIPDRVNDILDLLQNFRSVHINLETQEIFTA